MRHYESYRVPADDVASAARKVVSKILNKRRLRDEKRITDEMKKRRFILFGRTLTEHEAVRNLFEGRLYPSCYGADYLNTARELLLLAQAGDPVTVSKDDAFVLWGEW